MQALIVALGFLAAYEAVVEGQVQFISNETIFGTYDADIELPSCWSYYEIKGCRFVKRYLGFMDNWKEYGYWNFDDPDDMHPGETIDCSQTVSDLGKILLLLSSLSFEILLRISILLTFSVRKLGGKFKFDYFELLRKITQLCFHDSFRTTVCMKT